MHPIFQSNPGLNKRTYLIWFDEKTWSIFLIKMIFFQAFLLNFFKTRNILPRVFLSKNLNQPT